MQQLIKDILRLLIYLIYLIYFDRVQGQNSSQCEENQGGTCNKCPEGEIMNDNGICLNICREYENMSYSFIQKQCVYVCDAGYQENEGKCQKLVQCPEYLSAGQTSHTSDIDGIQVFGDQWIVSYSGDELIVWKIDNSRIKMITKSRQQDDKIFAVIFSSNGKYFFSFSNKRILIWSLEESYKLKSIDTSSSIIYRQNMLKYTEDQYGIIEQVLAFDKKNIIVMYVNTKDMNETNYKKLPQKKEIVNVGLMKNKKVYALTNFGEVLFWDSEKSESIIIFKDMIKLMLVNSIQLIKDQQKYGLYIEVFSNNQLQIFDVDNVQKSLISYKLPEHPSSNNVKFRSYVINKYRNEVYFIDNTYIYAYNLTSTKFIVRQIHKSTIQNSQILNAYSHNKGLYLIIQLDAEIQIWQRLESQIQQSEPFQSFDNQFYKFESLSFYTQVLITQGELLWVLYQNEIIANKIQLRNENPYISNFYSIKNIAQQKIVVPKQSVKAQAIIHFDEFYAIAFPQYIYIWSYKDHTLLYYIDLKQESNNSIFGYDKNNLLIYSDNQCNSLNVSCFNSIQIYELGINFASRIQQFNKLNIENSSTHVHYYQSFVYAITSQGNLYQITTKSQFEQKQFAISKESQIYTNMTSHFNENLLINIFKKTSIIEIRDITKLDQPNLTYKEISQVGINYYLHCSQQKTFTINLNNNTLIILYYNVTGFQILASRDTTEEQVLISAYNSKYQRIYLVQTTQILAYDIKLKKTTSKQWTHIFYQKAEKEVFISSSNLDLLAFIINKQLLIFYDMYTHRIINIHEFSRVNQLQIMYFNNNRNILHFLWENKTHSYTSLQQPYQKSLFTNKTLFEEKGYYLKDQNNFMFDEILFDPASEYVIKVSYSEKIIIFFDLNSEEEMRVLKIEFNFKDCLLITGKELLIFQAIDTSILQKFNFKNDTKPNQTQYKVNISFIQPMHQSKFKILLTDDNNSLIYLNDNYLIQLDINTMNIVNKIDLQLYFTEVYFIEKNLEKNHIQIRGFLKLTDDSVTEKIFIFDTQQDYIETQELKQYYDQVVFKQHSYGYVGITKQGISINSLGNSLLQKEIQINQYKYLDIKPQYLIAISKTQGFILDLQTYKFIDKWDDEYEEVQSAVYSQAQKIVIKKKETSIYVTQPYTGVVKLLIPISFQLDNYVFLEKKQLIILQLPNQIEIIDLISLKQKQKILFSQSNAQMIYVEQFNSFLMVEKKSNSIGVLAYDSEYTEFWKKASSNQKQVYIQSTKSVFFSDDEFQIWKFENFEFFQTNVYKAQIVQNLIYFQDMLIIVADNNISVYSHLNLTQLIEKFDQLIDEEAKLFKENEELESPQFLFFVGKRQIRQLRIYYDAVNKKRIIQLDVIVQQFEFQKKQVDITFFTFSFSLNKIIYSDSAGDIYFGKSVQMSQVLMSSEKIIRLKYIDSSDCLLITTNKQIIIKDFSTKRTSNLVTFQTQADIISSSIFKNEQILLILARQSIRLQIREIKDPSNPDKTKIDIQKIKSYMNPSYYPGLTQGQIVSEQILILYSLYYLNLYDNINNRFIKQVQVPSEILNLNIQQDIIFITTNYTLIIYQMNKIKYFIKQNTMYKIDINEYEPKKIPINQACILFLNITQYETYTLINAIAKVPDGISSIKFNIQNQMFIARTSDNEFDIIFFRSVGQKEKKSYCYATINSDWKLYEIENFIQMTRTLVDDYTQAEKNTTQIQIGYGIGKINPFILPIFANNNYQIKFFPDKNQIIDLSILNSYQARQLTLQGLTVILKNKIINIISSDIKKVIFEDIQLESQPISEQGVNQDLQTLKFDDIDEIILHNIRIKNQLFKNNSTFSFSRIKRVLMKDIYITNSTFINMTLFDIYEIDQVFIENINFVDINIIDFTSFFLFQNVKKLTIKNMVIERTKQVADKLNISDVYFYKLQEGYFCLNLLNILGCLNSDIDGVIFKNNQDVQFLSYLNSYNQQQQVVTLKHDVIKARNLNIMNNINIESDLTQIDIKAAEVHIENSYFYRNYCPLCYRSSCLFLYDSYEIYLLNVVSQNNLSVIGSSVYFSYITQIEITNCIFKKNTAIIFGGALFFEFLYGLKFKNTTVTENNAEIGGGIYYRAYYKRFFENIIIKNNTAKIYGQNIGSYPKKIQIIDDCFSHNNESENNNIPEKQQNDTVNNSGSEEQNENQDSNQNKNKQCQINNSKGNDDKLKRNLHEDKTNDQYLKGYEYTNETVIFNNFRSGDFLNLKFKMLDEEDNEIYLAKDKKYYNPQSLDLLRTFFILMVPDGTQSVKISGASQINIQNASPEDKLWSFNDLKIIGHPNKNDMHFRIVMGQIKKYEQYIDSEKTKILLTDFPSYEIAVTVNFRQCFQGEIYNCDDDSKFCTCSPCQIGYYSLQIYNDSKQHQVCEKCPESAFFCQKDQIHLKEGYWRISNKTDDIIQCMNAPSNCQSDNNLTTNSGDQICIKGHVGPLCEVCDTYGDYWGESYMRQNNYKCMPCQDLNNFSSVLPFLLIFFVMVFYIIFSIRVTIQLSKGYVYSYYFRKLGMINIGISSTQNQAQFYVKQFMHYLQIAVIINSHDFNVPYVTDFLPYLVSQPIKNALYSFDCVFAKMKKVIPIVFLRSVWSLIIPLFYAITIGIIYLCILIMKNSRRHNKFFIYNGLLFMLVLFQPGIVSSLFSVISCRLIGGIYYISADIGHECYTQQYYQYILILIFPGILLWGIAIPLFILKNIKMNSQRLDQFHMRLKFGFLYLDYNKKYSYWEFIKIYQKVIIMVLSNIFDEVFYTKQILICVIVISYYMLSVRRQPYLIKKFNKLDQRITISIFILIQLNIFLYSRENSALYSIFYWVCVILHNTILFFLLFKFLIAKLKTRYRSIIFKLMVRLKQILPFLFSFIKLQPPINSIRSNANWRKVQVAKNIIVRYSQNGFPITQIEQLRKPYQDQIQEIQLNLISVINSKRSKSDIALSNPSITKLKKNIDLLIPSQTSSIHKTPSILLKGGEEKDQKNKVISLIKNAKNSQANSQFRSSSNSNQQSTEINFQFNQTSLKSSEISPKQRASQFESLRLSPLQVSKYQFHAPNSNSRLDDNSIGSLTYLQKFSKTSPKGKQQLIVSSDQSENQIHKQQEQQKKLKKSSSQYQQQIPLLKQQSSQKQQQQSEKSAQQNKLGQNYDQYQQYLQLQSSYLHNSLQQLNSLQKSYNYNSAQNLNEDSNIQLFSSGGNLSPYKFRQGDIQQYSPITKYNQSLSKVNSPRSQYDLSSKVQENLIPLSSTSSISSSPLSQSSVSQNERNKKKFTDEIDEFIKQPSPHSYQSKTINDLALHKAEDIEFQTQQRSPKSSPQFQVKEFFSYPSLKGDSQLTGINQINQRVIRRDSNQVGKKFPQSMQIKQTLQDSLFSFQSQDALQTNNVFLANKQSLSLMSFQKQNSPQILKLQSQSTFKSLNDNMDQQTLSENNISQIQENKKSDDLNLEFQEIQDDQSNTDIPNQPNFSNQARSCIKELQNKKTGKKQHNLSIDNKQKSVNSELKYIQHMESLPSQEQISKQVL